VGLEAATDDGDNGVARRRTPRSGRVRMRTDRGRALGADGGNAEVDGWARLEGKRMKTPTNLESVTN